MRLAFQNKWTEGFTEKEVEITLCIATLEALAKDMGIELWEISDRVKKEPAIFMIELLYYGYIVAGKDKYEKPKYNKSNAVLWYEKMSREAQAELLEKINLLSGEIDKMSGKKKSKNNI